MGGGFPGAVMKLLPAAAIIAAVSAALILSEAPGKKAARLPGGETPAKIGIVYYGPDEATENGIRGFRDGLAEKGFIDGKNIIITEKHAGGETAGIPQLINFFAGNGADLIVPMTTPCVAAACAAASKNIRTPFVFCSVYYPLNAGAGRTASDHLPNVTGAGCPPPLEETVRAVKTLLPAAAKAGTVFNSSEANSSRAVSKARKLFAGMKISLEAVSVQSTNEISEALRALKAKDIQFLWLTGDNTVLQCFPMIADFCAKNSLPLTVNDTEICGGGAVLACGTGFYRNGRAGGLIAARVLQGENPADIPIETTVTADIVLNFAPAKKLGLTFPSGLVERSVRFLNLKERLGRPLRIAALKAGGAADSGAEAGFLKGLKAAGLVEGADFLVRDCENKPELKNGKYDLVFLCGPPAAGDSSGLPESVPVVSASADGADLKKNGLEASLAAARILAGARPDRVTVKIPPEAGDTAGSL